MKTFKKLIFTVLILLAMVWGGRMIQDKDPVTPVPASLKKNKTVTVGEPEKETPPRSLLHKPSVSEIEKKVRPEDHDKKIIELYRKKYTEIMQALKQMDFDFEEMSEELRDRLKASENGKLEREEILELFPPEIADKYGEMLDLLSELKGEGDSTE